jgi:hypothetical protein
MIDNLERNQRNMKTKLTLRAALVTVALSLAAAVAVARSSALREPERTEIVAIDNAKASTPKSVRSAIIAGGAHHGWKPVADKPGVLTLTAATGGHEVTVDVHYDATSFQVKYKSSANMNEEKSGDQISVHPKVNKWLADLNEDIRSSAVAGVSPSR